MNTLKTSNGEYMKKYHRLKHYWKLLLKKESELSHTEYKLYPLFNQRLEVNIVKEMLDYDVKLKTNYTLYQQLLRAISDRDFKTLERILQAPHDPLVLNYVRTSLKTFSFSPIITNVSRV